jgi:hypothetical protein
MTRCQGTGPQRFRRRRGKGVNAAVPGADSDSGRWLDGPLNTIKAFVTGTDAKEGQRRELQQQAKAMEDALQGIKARLASMK